MREIIKVERCALPHSVGDFRPWSPALVAYRTEMRQSILVAYNMENHSSPDGQEAEKRESARRENSHLR